jgi:hypothetical protein
MSHPSPSPSARAAGARVSWLALAVLCATAGACDAGGGLTDTTGDDFRGTWIYITSADSPKGTRVMHDPSGDPSLDTTEMMLPEGNKRFARGVYHPLTDLTVFPLTLDGLTCNFGFDINGQVATAAVPQTCSYDAAGDSMSVVEWTFTLTEPNKAMESGSATITLHTPTGSTIVDSTQDYTLTAALFRVSKD